MVKQVQKATLEEEKARLLKKKIRKETKIKMEK